MIYKLNKDDPGFPEMLREINMPPSQIYCNGNVELLKSPCVAIVGSRRCTQYGVTVAKSIGKRLAENGVTIVSGMARGIDTAAHKGALEAEGNTIAVFGCGLDLCYPSENRGLKREIEKNGLIISEYSVGMEAKPFTFPERNRIISGISESVIIVEAANRSGSLITAELAADQSRNVYAVPGNITSAASFGSNKLIREGVTPLILIDDVLTDMGITPGCEENIMLRLGEDERSIYNVVKKSSEVTFEEICAATGLSPAAVSGVVTVLEMKGIVVSSMGKVFIDKIVY